MSPFLLVHHDAFGRHETPAGHVEQPARYHAVADALRGSDLEAEWVQAPLATAEQVAVAHDAGYIAAIEAAASQAAGGEIVMLDPDTALGPSTLEAAFRAAGGAIFAAEEVMAGRARSAFVATRPPGHHAEPGQAMGFCFFGNAALAALRARALGAARVAILDFDVHHGNGTQAIVENDPTVFFASSHEWPQYPGTGPVEDRGPHGTCLNLPIPSGTSGSEVVTAWRELILPKVEAFAPEFVVISAGFDAHMDDPLGGLGLSAGDYAEITKAIVVLAADLAAGRIVSVLEGGYDLPALGQSALAHVKALASADDAR